MKWLRPLLLIAASTVLAASTPWRPESRSGVVSVAADGQSCRPPRPVARTYVGFPEGRDWAGDFEPAALEASRILAATQAQSCQLTLREDESGTLRDALQSSPVAITAVLFERGDFATARVQMQHLGDAESRWSVQVVRAREGDWQVVSARRQ
jgi:hypothetical protein